MLRDYNIILFISRESEHEIKQNITEEKINKKRWNNLKEKWKTNINNFIEKIINYIINKDKEDFIILKLQMKYINY